MRTLDILKYNVVFLKNLLERFPEGTIAYKEISKLVPIGLYDLCCHVESYAYNEGLDPKKVIEEQKNEKEEKIQDAEVAPRFTIDIDRAMPPVLVQHNTVWDATNNLRMPLPPENRRDIE